MSNYMIGTTQAGLVDLASLTVPVRSPKFTFDYYSQALQLGSGLVRGGGWPVASWIWSSLPAAQRDQLRVFCPGASALIYIQTRVNSNLSGVVDQFRQFQAVMVWPVPEGERDFTGIRTNLVIKFQKMVDVT